jgi:molybdenum cofactor cytidylyltransferase
MRAPSFAGVILAAGESSRMGRDKALLPWHGKTFLQAHIEVLYPHTELVIVVAGKNHGALAPVVYATGAFLIENPRPELGQFSSLQVGLREVLNRGRDAAIIGLVDRPPCKSETVALLRERFLAVYPEGQWAVVPEFGDKHGHPIIAGREMIEAFLKAPATSTARDVEHAVQKLIVYVPVPYPAVVMNVDTPEHYERLQIRVP